MPASRNETEKCNWSLMRHIVQADLDDTLECLNDDFEKIEFKAKTKNILKETCTQKIGRRGLMLDNLNKKLKGNFFKFIVKLFQEFGFKIGKIPQIFVTNVSVKRNKFFIDKPLSILFDYYSIEIPSIISDECSRKCSNPDEELAKFCYCEKTALETSSSLYQNSVLQCDKTKNQLDTYHLKKLIYEMTFEEVFENVFLQSEYYRKIIDDFEIDPRYPTEYLRKFKEQATLCMKNLKGVI